MKKRTTIIVVVLLAGFAIFVAATLINNKKDLAAQVYHRDTTQAVRVTVEALGYQPFNRTLELTGSFEPDRQVNISSQAQGQVVYVGVQEGDYVKAGALLCRLDDELIRAQLIAAEASFADAQRELGQQERLTAGGASTPLQLDKARLGAKQAESQLKQLQKQLANTRITAPFSGVITSQNYDKGSIVAPGSPIAQLTDVSSLDLVVNVAEEDLPAFREGEAVQVVASAYPNLPLTGEVAVVPVTADASRTFPVQVSVRNPEKNPLKAGMLARVVIESDTDAQTLLIPRTALVGSAKNPQVYLLEKDRARLVDIQTGAFTTNQIEVRAGLQPGDQVITSGLINLENNTPVQVAGGPVPAGQTARNGQ